MQRKLQAARDAIQGHYFNAALKLCKEAQRLDPMSLAPLPLTAEANLCGGRPSMCVVAYELIAKRRNELGSEERQAPAHSLHGSDLVYLTTLIQSQACAFSSGKTADTCSAFVVKASSSCYPALRGLGSVILSAHSYVV